MAKYRQVHTSIWKDPSFENYSADEKLIFIYLCSNASTSESGIYPISFKTIAYETGLLLETVSKPLVNGSIKNIYYDNEEQVVFIKNFRKYNPGGNPALVKKAILSDFEKTEKSWVWSVFLNEYNEFSNLLPTVGKPLVNGCRKNSTIGNGICSCIGSCSCKKDLKPNTADSQETANPGTCEKVESLEPENREPKPVGKKKAKGCEPDHRAEWFNEDWDSYPRKSGNKAKAMAHYLKTVTSEEKRGLLQAKIKAETKTKSDPKYIKTAETFFRNWENLEYSELQSQRGLDGVKKGFKPVVIEPAKQSPPLPKVSIPEATGIEDVSWKLATHEIYKQILPDNFNRWIAPCRLAHINGTTAVLVVPDTSHKVGIEENYLETIEQQLGRRVQVVTDEQIE